jgi:hypothetical protein
MLHVVALSFFAGLFAGNATPHFVKGITKEPFPSLLGSAPAVNLVAGWAMLLLAAVLAQLADLASHPAAATAAAAAGVLAIGLFHATVGAFGRGS